MDNQPKYEPLEVSNVFADRQSSRHLVPGTVARGYSARDEYDHDEHHLTGLVDGEPAEEFPPGLLGRWDSARLLRRGRERFMVFCAPCHGMLGDGNGRVAQRGYPHPPSFHTPDLRERPVGHIFRVIMDGKGKMPEYGKRVPPDDRWAIAAYVKALQLSQNAQQDAVPAEVWQRLQEMPEESALTEAVEGAATHREPPKEATK